VLLKSDGLSVEVVRRDARDSLSEHLPGVHLQLQLVGPRVHQVPRPHTCTSQGSLSVSVTEVNPLMGSLKPQSNRPLYSNTVICTLAIDG